MHSKWSFICCFFAFTNSFMISAVNCAECVKPSNAIPFTLSQLKGVWHHQLVTDFPINVSLACDRSEIFVSSDKNTAYEADTIFIESTNTMRMVVLKHQQVAPDELVATPLEGGLAVSVKAYILLLTEEAVVGSVCFTMNGQVLGNFIEVSSRSQTMTKERARSLVKSVGVTCKSEYFINNHNECYSNKCKPRGS